MDFVERLKERLELATETKVRPASETIAGAVQGFEWEDNERLYQVGFKDEVRYVVSNSPGQAAMSVVNVKRVSDKDVSKALVEQLNEVESTKDSEETPGEESK